MIKVSLKTIQSICCGIVLLLICVAPLRVHAAEDSGILSSASAKVYSAMSEGSDVTANLIVGSMFEVLGAESDGNGVVWYQVRTDFGAEGYVKADELDRVLMQVQQQQQEPPQEPVPNEGDEGGEGEAPANEDGDDEEDGEGDAEGADENQEQDVGDGNETPLGTLVVLESVNLRRMPSTTNSEIMGRINLNTELPYFERYINNANEVWYRVQYEDMTGYVTEGAVMLQQQESLPGEDMQLSSEEAVQDPIQEKKLVQVEQQSEEEIETATNANQIEFEIDDEKPDFQIKLRFDWMLVLLVIGVAICIAAIFILMKKILKLLENR